VQRFYYLFHTVSCTGPTFDPGKHNGQMPITPVVTTHENTALVSGHCILLQRLSSLCVHELSLGV